MTTIHIRTIDQVLSATILPSVACNNQNTVRLLVDFDEKWDGYGKSAVFYTSKNPVPYEKIFSVDNICFIPPEVLVEEGHLYITVKGIKGAEVKTSTPLKLKIMPGTPALVMSDPTKDVYHQLIDAYAESSDRAENEAEKRAAADRLIKAEMLTAISRETTARIARDATEKSERQAEIAVERAKIAQLREVVDALAEGEDWESQIEYDEFAAEVQDTRIDADGKEHTGAGDAVRAQVNDLRGGVIKENLIDFDKMLPGFLNANDSIGLSHQTTNFYRWEYVSDFIPVTYGLPYILTILYDREVAGWYCLSTYDSNKIFISRAYVQEFNELAFSRTFAALGSDVAFVRISYRSHMAAKVKFEQSTYFSGIEEETFADNILASRPLVHDGYIVESGSIYPPTAEDYSDAGHVFEEKYGRHIPVAAGETYVLYQNAEKYPWCGIGFYGTDGKGIQRIVFGKNGKFEFTVPEGAIAMMVSARTYYLTDIALFKKGNRICEDQKVRDNYIELQAANEQLFALNNSNINSVAHRGYSTEAPENTLAAYRLAKQKGFTYVECDVSFTSDGYAVLLHDSTIDRTSNGTGNVSDLTLAQLLTYDFGSWKSEAYAGEKIPRFEEFIALCKHLGLHPYIEIKTGTEDQIKGLASVVKRYGMKGKVTWISFSAACLGYVKTVDPKARLGFTVDSLSTSTINTVIRSLRTGYNEVFIDCAQSNANENAVTLCMNADIPLEVWTVNSEGSMFALNPYISGVTSDNLIASKLFYNNNIGG